MNSAFNRELNNTITRMEESQAWQVHDAINKGGEPVRGCYYEGGPICVEVRTERNHLSCIASVYDALYTANNEPRKVAK